MNSADILRRHDVRVSGCGRETIVFAPGFGCDKSMWRFVAPAFEQDYRVILFDYVGSGQSDYTAYDSSKYRKLDGYAQDVLEICSALKLEQVIFIGHSVGATIGMLAALQQPELFKQLILVAPSPCYLNDPPAYIGGFEKEEINGLIHMMEMNFIGWADYLSAIVMKNPRQPELAQELGESFCSNDPVIAREFAIATFFSDHRACLPDVRVPALILQCADDAIVPQEVGSYMHQHLPQSKLQQMEATGHCPHMSHPEETIRAISEYVTESEFAT